MPDCISTLNRKRLPKCNERVSHSHIEASRGNLRQEADGSGRSEEELITQRFGKPSIGGPFTLTDANGQPFTEKELLGKWTLIYFGFTHCPDICPEELDKMGEAVDKIQGFGGENSVLPLFISVDPARDSVAQVKKYIQGEC